MPTCVHAGNAPEFQLVNLVSDKKSSSHSRLIFVLFRWI